MNNEIFFPIQKCFFCFPILNSSDMAVKLFSNIYLRNLSNIKIKTFSVFYSKILRDCFPVVSKCKTRIGNQLSSYAAVLYFQQRCSMT